MFEKIKERKVMKNGVVTVVKHRKVPDMQAMYYSDETFVKVQYEDDIERRYFLDYNADVMVGDKVRGNYKNFDITEKISRHTIVDEITEAAAECGLSVDQFYIKVYDEIPDDRKNVNSSVKKTVHAYWNEYKKVSKELIRKEEMKKAAKDAELTEKEFVQKMYQELSEAEKDVDMTPRESVRTYWDAHKNLASRMLDNDNDDDDENDNNEKNNSINDEIADDVTKEVSSNKDSKLLKATAF